MRLIWTPKLLLKKWPKDDLPDVITVWQRQLSRFSPQTIARATQAMINRGLEYPPDLPVFKKLCWENQVRPEHRLALPEPWPDKEVAKRGLAKLREAMK
jgi:hypothetical protein